MTTAAAGPVGPGRQGGGGPVPHLLGEAHHDGSELYVPQGPALGDVVPVRVRVPHGLDVSDVHIRVVRDGEATYVPTIADGRDGADRWFTADVEMHNPVTSYRALLHGGGGDYAWLNGTGTWDRDVTDQSDFRLSVHGGAPAWLRRSVVYQIFPDRFARSGASRQPPAWSEPADWDDPVVGEGPSTPVQYYGGDLEGIEQHLDYLHDLGVGTIYLTPIFPAQSNHRYNATTFDTVDPLLGGDAALASLSDAVHRRGMGLIGDFTTNHTGDTHEWFQTALAYPASAEAGYYYWREEAPGYVGWLDVPTLPKLNYRGQGLLERMALGEDSVTARWMRPPMSLDGWRIDVANMTGRYGRDDFAHTVARAMRSTMARINPESALIAEHNFDAAGDLSGEGWQGTMNYAGFMRPVWNWLVDPNTEVEHFLGLPNRIPRRPGRSVAGTMREVASTVSWPIALSQWNSLDTHDTPRLRTVTQDATADALAATLLFTYPGTPMMFAGLELGARGLNGEYGRVPMPWDRPAAWEQETFHVMRSLTHLRNRTPALRDGGMRWAVVHDDALAYLRETHHERILVLVARDNWPGAILPRELLADRAEPENLFGSDVLRVSSEGLHLSGEGPTAQVWRLA
jgi:alpha-glucosidase